MPGNPRRAPAGYGKTWLLARRYSELRAAGHRVVWLGIEEADPAQFLGLLAAGLTRTGLDTGELDVIASEGLCGAPLASAVQAVCAALASGSAPITIFIDDVHRADRDLLEMLSRPISQ